MARLLHWAIAGAIVLQYVLAKLAERAAEADQTVKVLGLLGNHKSVGITIAGLAVIRLAWRLINPPPLLPDLMPGWQIRISKISHWTLYALLIALPLSGWLMSSASAYSVSWFGLATLPDLTAPDQNLKHLLERTHEVLAYGLAILAIAHIAAAFKHLLIDRDNVMSRMTSVPMLALFAALIGGGVFALADPVSQTRGSTGATATNDESPVDSDPVTPLEMAQAEPAAPEVVQETASDDVPTVVTDADRPPSQAPLASWEIDYDRSFIRFTGDQAGAPFTGEWTDWQANILFSENALSQSLLDVTVNTAQVDTQDPDRDATIIDAEWFDTSNYPQATYYANRFSVDSEGRFSGHGTLTVKDHAVPVVLTFTVTQNPETVVVEARTSAKVLSGNTVLDRLALKLGTGDWEDTSWVGQEVSVEVRVEARVR